MRQVTKKCSVCKKHLPATEEFFNRSNQHSLGLYTWCKECTSDKHQQSKYGLKPGQKQEIYATQDGQCIVCKKSIPFKQICTDHNHNTGKVRGLLCIFCNTLCGYIEKHPGLMIKAAEYLEKNN